MKIKKHGKHYQKEEQIKTEKFECKECGCEFTAKDDEYYVDYGTGNLTSSTTSSITYTWSTTVTDWYICSCPECHKIVKKPKLRDTTSTSPYYTVTCNAADININPSIKSTEDTNKTSTTTTKTEWLASDSLSEFYTSKIV